MIKRILFIGIVLAAISVLEVKCQDFSDLDWVKFIRARGFDEGYFIKTDDSSNVIVMGEYGTNLGGLIDTMTCDSYSIVSHGNQDIYMMKLDRKGNVIWLNGIGSKGFDRLHGFDIDSEGNILMFFDFIGQLKMNGKNYNQGGMVAKYSPGGVFIWNQFIDRNSDTWLRQEGILIDSNDDFVIIDIIDPTRDWVYTIDSNTYPISAETVALSKFSATGNIIWTRLYTSSHWIKLGSIDITVDNDVLFAASIYDDIVIDNDTLYSDTSGELRDLVVKVNPNGQTLWSKSYFSNTGFLWDMEAVADGNIAVATYFGIKTYYLNDSVVSNKVNAAQCLFYLLDSDGEMLMAKHYSSDGNSGPLDVCPSPDGNIILSGYRFDNKRAFLKINTSGQVIDELVFSSYGNWSPLNMCFDKTENFLCKAFFSADPVIQGDTQTFPGYGIAILKFGDSTLAGASELTSVQSELSIRPNPAFESVEITYGDRELNRISIYDISGALLLSEECANSPKLNIDISGLSSGSYIVIAQSKMEHYDSEVLIILR